MEQFKFSKDDYEFTVDIEDGRVVDSSNQIVMHKVNAGLTNWGFIRKEMMNRGFDMDEVGGEDKKVTKSSFADVGVLSKIDEDKRLVFGWAYVTHDSKGNIVVDKSGEMIEDWQELEDAAYEFVIKSRVGGDQHDRDLAANTARQVGVMVESIVFTPEKIEKMGIPPGSLPTGWWVGFRVEDPAVWQAVKRGERPAFSIHGNARKEAIE